MSKIPYLNYDSLNEFYTIEELCRLLGASRSELTDKCKKHNVALGYNAHRKLGLPKGAVRKLHYQLYHETHNKQQCGTGGQIHGDK